MLPADLRLPDSPRPTATSVLSVPHAQAPNGAHLARGQFLTPLPGRRVPLQHAYARTSREWQAPAFHVLSKLLPLFKTGRAVRTSRAGVLCPDVSRMSPGTQWALNRDRGEQVDSMAQMVPLASKFPDSKIRRVRGQRVPCEKMTRKASWRRW